MAIAWTGREVDRMSVEDVVAQVRADEVRLVRFLYCDPSGVIRGKNVHVDRLAGKIREGIGLTRAQNSLNMLDVVVPVDGMEPVGEIRIVPDPDTCSRLPWVPDRRDGVRPAGP